MKGKKIIIISIIINILLIGVIYNFIKKDYINTEEIIVKAMTGTEYENNIASLNISHEEYANYIEESKRKIANAITEMGVNTSGEESLETMVNNIKNIDRSSGEFSGMVIASNCYSHENNNIYYDYSNKINVTSSYVPWTSSASTSYVTFNTDETELEFHVFIDRQKSGSVTGLNATNATISSSLIDGAVNDAITMYSVKLTDISGTVKLSINTSFSAVYYIGLLIK